MNDIVSKFQPLFYPRSVALFGATDDVRKWGFALFHNLLKGGFEGTLYPINVRKDTIFGIKAYKSLAEIPQSVDLVVIAIPPLGVIQAVKECAELKVGAVVVNTAGFAETGAQGKAMEEKIQYIAKCAGFPLIGPNSQGVMSTPAKLFPQMMGIQPLGGKISMVSQSGNIGGTIMTWGRKWMASLGKFVSSGNEAVTTSAELIEYFSFDVQTKVIGAYIEGVKDGAQFANALRTATVEKPVIILKGGRTDAGSNATASHTASMAGEIEVFNALLRQTGAIKADNLEELFDFLSAFNSLPLPKGKNVAIITQGGGWGVLAADTARECGLHLAKLPQQAIKELNAVLPDRWSHGNPVDLAAGGGRGVVEKCIEVLIRCHSVDAIALLGMGTSAILKWNMKDSPVHSPERISELSKRADDIEEKLTGFVIDAMREYKKPIVCSSDVVGSPHEAESPAVKIMKEAGLIIYPSPERCMRTLSVLAQFSTRKLER